MMRLDLDFLKDFQHLVDGKVAIWKEQFPRLEFDKWGRAKLMPLTGIKETDCGPLRYASESFTKAFNEYLEQKGYEMRDKYNEYASSFNSHYIAPYDYVENYYHFRKDEGKLVRIKASKVLAAVQEIWLNSNPTFKDVNKQIKALREQGATYESSEELREIMAVKSSIEEGNLNVIYQSIMNQHNGNGSGVFISVNPLDLLTSSGGGDGSPTNFNSCWSTRMYSSDEYIEVKKDGCYSDPEDIIALGRIENRAILYIPNGRHYDIPNTDFSLLGYRERVHGWFDTNPHGIWLEKVYPSGSDSALIKYSEALVEKNIETIEKTFNNSFDFQRFTYEDSRNLNVFEEDSRSVFLDRVAIQNGSLYYMPDIRTEYNYDGDIIGLMDDSAGEICEDCGCRCSDDHYISNHGYVCNSCYDDYSYCYDCETHHHENDMQRAYRGSNDYQVCTNCLRDDYIFCEECNEYHHTDYTTYVNGSYYVCDDCRDENYSYCEHCDEYHNFELYETVNGALVCEVCKDEFFIICDDCNRYTLTEDEIEVKGGNIVCEKCLQDEGYTFCESCSEYSKDNFHETNEGYICEECGEEKYTCEECGSLNTTVTIDKDGINLCQECVKESYGYCESCGEEYHNDGLNTVESEDKVVCNNCLTRYYFQCDECKGLYIAHKMDGTEDSKVVCVNCLKVGCLN